ncbi:hypothetical protein RND71_034033 [Anisodus tanguticus]|uniref:peroxidase n=1 Tax=Anisodus tanguticus TaxID=243964 RepID=A0AAE1V3T2_9SOLA|nr:hypothetical protein RND71_034033 [Anisodus tanguticus]
MKSFSSSITFVSLTAALFLVATVSSQFDDIDLPFDYYSLSCPQLESIMQKKVEEWIKKDYSLAPALMRLHFHDCFVRGCDASILLDHEGSEKSAKASKTLRGFEVIDDIKRELEKACPKTVSCADILTAAARDATIAVGGPFWMVPYGRKDGIVSMAKEADKLIPMGHELVTDLLEFFQSKGLNVLDLVVLSDPRTAPIVTALATQPDVFENLFAASMVKMGNIQDYLSINGEVRLNCERVNSPNY